MHVTSGTEGHVVVIVVVDTENVCNAGVTPKHGSVSWSARGESEERRRELLRTSA